MGQTSEVQWNSTAFSKAAPAPTDGEPTLIAAVFSSKNCRDDIALPGKAFSPCTENPQEGTPPCLLQDKHCTSFLLSICSGSCGRAGARPAWPQ